MKLTFFNAFLILTFGMLIVLTGVVLKVEANPYSQSVIFIGLAVEFLGTLWFVLSLYRRRKNM